MCGILAKYKNEYQTLDALISREMNVSDTYSAICSFMCLTSLQEKTNDKPPTTPTKTPQTPTKPTSLDSSNSTSQKPLPAFHPDISDQIRFDWAKYRVPKANLEFEVY